MNNNSWRLVMGNAKEILNKYKILLTVIILLIASVLLYVVVFNN